MDPATFLTELKRRKVYRVAVAYAIVAWLLIQAASILFPTFEAPPWVMQEPKHVNPTPQGISKISTCLAMPRSKRFSGVAAMPFDCNSFEASLLVTTRLVAKMERDVASPWTRAAIFTVRPK